MSTGDGILFGVLLIGVVLLIIFKPEVIALIIGFLFIIALLSD